MSCDKLVFDLANEVEGTPNIFVKKDWLSILDNQNGNYGSNQSIVDSSQLSNANKFLSYREAYLSIPLLITVTSGVGAAVFLPATAGTSADYSIGLKNWFGSVIHSFTLDYNGTTIIQQTPFINMWNSFKLMTSLSWSDVATTGATIGFYPDDPLSWSYNALDSASGIGVCNNSNACQAAVGALGVATSGEFNRYKSNNGNIGMLKRQQYINYDVDGDSGSGTYADLLTANSAQNLWKSHISRKVNSTALIGGVFQISVRATVYLKHIHSFFQMIPLLKGVFLKMTLNLNNSSCTFNGSAGAAGNIVFTSSSVPVGGVQPLMIAPKIDLNGGTGVFGNGAFTASLSVGATCLNQAQITAGAITGAVGTNIFLYVPAYTFNPVFEQAYLSSQIKTIAYNDVYQYQVINVGAGQQFNNLLTNGLANIKSVLILPFLTAMVPGGAGASATTPVYQSPFDPAGTGPTSPLAQLTNFNVVVSGQNAIYNTQRYSFEQFNNQLYGVNAVNGGMTDGLTSGLIDQLGFEMEYNYYYVNVSRMLPVEEQVPKSVYIVGQNTCALPLNLWCFVEYGMEVSISVLTGARV